MKIRPIAKGLRDRLPKGSQSWLYVDPALKKSVLAFFPEVEIIFCRGQYDVYRLLKPGVTKHEDLLIHEFTITKPLGSWLIEFMMKHDAYRNVPNQGKNPLVDHFLKLHDQHDEAREKEYNRKLDDAIYALAHGFLTIGRGPESVIKGY